MQVTLQDYIREASIEIVGTEVCSINSANIFLHFNTGNAAFLSNQDYHHAKAMGLLLSANHHGSLETACDYCDYSAPIQPYNRDDIEADERESLLDTLVPLNEVAAVELHDQYEKLGIYHSLDDLIDRLPRKFQSAPLLQAAE